MYIISFLPQSRRPGLLCDNKLRSSRGNVAGSVTSCWGGKCCRRALARDAVVGGRALPCSVGGPESPSGDDGWRIAAGGSS